MQVKIKQLQSLIVRCIKAKKVAMIHGSPAIGKSQVAHQIAKKYNLKVIDLRLSQCDPTDLMGFPSVTGKRAGYLPMDTFPIEGDEIPEGYDGWLLFLDELTSAPSTVQAAAYKLILDRMVGNHRLHAKVAVIGAGNLETDGAIVHTMSTALQSRLVHFELVVDYEQWCEWAMTNGIDHRITDFIKFKPSNLYTFKADHTDLTYASPRTWEDSSLMIPDMDESNPDMLPLLAGTISEGVAREFITFTKIYESLPKMADIQANPTKVAVPDEPSVLFALTGSISNYMNPQSADNLIKYVRRLPVEFQIVTLKETVRRNQKMIEIPAVKTWLAESAEIFF